MPKTSIENFRSRTVAKCHQPREDGTTAQGFSGDGGPASDAMFNIITGLAAVPGGGLLVADYDNQRVRYIAPDSINLVGDTGQTEFHLPWVSALYWECDHIGQPQLDDFLDRKPRVRHRSDPYLR